MRDGQGEGKGRKPVAFIAKAGAKVGIGDLGSWSGGDGVVAPQRLSRATATSHRWDLQVAVMVGLSLMRFRPLIGHSDLLGDLHRCRDSIHMGWRFADSEGVSPFPGPVYLFTPFPSGPGVPVYPFLNKDFTCPA